MSKYNRYARLISCTKLNYTTVATNENTLYSYCIDVIEYFQNEICKYIKHMVHGLMVIKCIAYADRITFFPYKFSTHFYHTNFSLRSNVEI